MSYTTVRRRILDHLRYMANQEERKARQREYYKAHREQCRESVRRSQCKRILKDLEDRERNYERTTEHNRRYADG